MNKRNINIRKKIRQVLSTGEELSSSQILDRMIDIQTVTSSKGGVVNTQRRSKAGPPTLRQLSAILPIEAKKSGFDVKAKQTLWVTREE